MSSSEEEVTKFVEKLTEVHGEHIQSVLSYRSIDGKERLVVVMGDEVRDVPEFLAGVYYSCFPPEVTLWLRRRELFQLALGVGGIPLLGGEGLVTEPFDYYRLKSKGEILYGDDVRAEIPDLDDPKGVVMANISLCLCYIRNHVILDFLSRRQYRKTVMVLLGILERIMSLALVMKGRLDIEDLELPRDFSDEYPDTEQAEMLSDVFSRRENIAEAGEDDERWSELAYDAVWVFESLSRWIMSL